jgi:hypothetical protein
MKVPRQCSLVLVGACLRRVKRWEVNAIKGQKGDSVVSRRNMPSKRCVVCDPNFDVTMVKHEVECGNLGTNSAFALGPRKTSENLDAVGRSQNFRM